MVQIIATKATCGLNARTENDHYILDFLFSHFDFVILGISVEGQCDDFDSQIQKSMKRKMPACDKSKNYRWFLSKLPDQKGSREENSKRRFPWTRDYYSWPLSKVPRMALLAKIPRNLIGKSMDGILYRKRLFTWQTRIIARSVSWFDLPFQSELCMRLYRIFLEAEWLENSAQWRLWNT